MIIGKKILTFIVIILVTVAVTNFSAAQISDTLVSVKDNTLYEDPGGGISNGAGNYFFTGKTAGNLIRRGLIAFDLSDIPPCATITSVKMTLHMSKTITGNRSVQLRKVLENWGEGTSAPGGEEGFGTTAAPGDATWIHAYYDTLEWSRDGGTFSSDTSANILVDQVGFYSWSTSGMVSDVQNWIADPSQNFGWLLLCDESTTITAKRFDTRENPTLGSRPKLVVTYTNNAVALNLTSLIEGFWNGQTMIRDTVDVYLRNSTAPFAKVDSARVNLSDLGNGTLCFPNAASGSYYIHVKHRNSIQTWSKTPQSFTTGSVTNYDFTTSKTKAFGNNMILKLGKYCIYSGDVNQDGTIDGTDTQLIDNDATNFVSGYVLTDVNGDEFVDGSDAAIAGNNAQDYVIAIIPE